MHVKYILTTLFQKVLLKIDLKYAEFLMSEVSFIFLPKAN